MSIQSILTIARPPAVHPRLERTSWTVLRAAVFTLGAGAIHLTVMPPHFQEYPLYGVFFLAAALAQAGLAGALLFSPGRLIAVAGADGNLAIVGLWVVSRTVGLPIGPDPWHPETAGVADTAAAILELLAAWNLLRWARRQGKPQRAAARYRIRRVLALAPGLLLTVAGIQSGTEAMPARGQHERPGPDRTGAHADGQPACGAGQ